MNLLRVFLLSIFAINPFVTKAENSLATSAVIQFKNGAFCGLVSEKDLSSSGFACSKLDVHKRLLLPAADVFEWSVFQVAAQNQIEKNNCLIEQMDAIMKSPQMLQIWYSQLAQAWLGLKKSKIVYEICHKEVLERLEPAEIKRFGLQKAYSRSIQHQIFQTRKPLDSKWANICTDEKALSALKAASELFPYSLPVVSSSELFEIFEKHRSLLINKKTGKPISDADILKEDLHDLKFVKLTKDPKFESSISAKLTELLAERKDISDDIKRSDKNGSFELGSDLKTYIYEDQTLIETLDERFPEQKGKMSSARKHSNAEKCLISKFESDFTASLTGFAIESAFFGGALLKGAKHLSMIGESGNIKNVSAALTQGAQFSTYSMIFKEITRSCPVPLVGDKAHKTQKVVSRKDGEMAAAELAANLPSDIDYKRFFTDINPKLTPSCQSEKQKNLMLNSLYSSNCLLDTISSVAPLKISLPLIFLAGRKE